MVSDLINRQAAIRAVANYLWHYPNEQYKNLNVFEIAESLAKDALSTVPSTDRPTGEWIMYVDDLYPEESTQECSNCHKHETIFIRHDNYCPNCGARMKGEE